MSGDPRVLLSGIKGKPVINFDGNDLLWTAHDFDHLTNKQATPCLRLHDTPDRPIIGLYLRVLEISFLGFMELLQDDGMQKDGFLQLVHLIQIGICM